MKKKYKVYSERWSDTIVADKMVKEDGSFVFYLNGEILCYWPIANTIVEVVKDDTTSTKGVDKSEKL
jgi:hypothetical protein